MNPNAWVKKKADWAALPDVDLEVVDAVNGHPVTA